MKAIFISYNQAYDNELILLLEEFGQRGYSLWRETEGRGGVDGEPHLGSHAWPVMNNSLLSVVEDSMADKILEALKKKDEATPELGLHAFTWRIEKSV